MNSQASIENAAESEATVKERYKVLVEQRQKSITSFQQEVARVDNETKNHTRRIDEDLLTDFFEDASKKPASSRDRARSALEKLNKFNETVLGLHTEIAEMSMNLHLTHSSLMFDVMKAFFKPFSDPVDVIGKTPLEIAKQGLETFKAAGSDSRNAYVSYMSDACVIERQAITTVELATLILQVRRQHLWEFRRKNLTVTRSELKERVQKYGADASSEEVSDWFWEALQEILEEEFEDITWIKRTKRWGAVVLRLAAGKHQVRRDLNDTDQVNELLDLMDSETRILEKFKKSASKTNHATNSIRIAAENESNTSQH